MFGKFSSYGKLSQPNKRKHFIHIDLEYYEKITKIKAKSKCFIIFFIYFKKFLIF